MAEVLHEAFLMVNAIPTFFLILSLLYWLIVILGLIDMNMLDFEVETPEAEVEIDVDVDADVETEVSISWMNNILTFFNIGKVPFMIFFTFFALSCWVASILMNYYVNPMNSFFFSLLLFIPNFISSLFVAKFVTIPFVKIFEKLADESLALKNAVGKKCIVIIPVSPNKMGQAEIKDNGTVLRINAISDSHSFEKGSEALVIDFIKEKNQYLIETYN